jgi:hypothetical protein
MRTAIINISTAFVLISSVAFCQDNTFDCRTKDEFGIQRSTLGRIIEWITFPPCKPRERIPDDLRKKYSIPDEFTYMTKFGPDCGSIVIFEEDLGKGYYIWSDGSWYKGMLKTDENNTIKLHGVGTRYYTYDEINFEGKWNWGQYVSGTLYDGDAICIDCNFEPKTGEAFGENSSILWKSGEYKNTKYYGELKNGHPKGCGKIELSYSGNIRDSVSNKCADDRCFKIPLLNLTSGDIYIGGFDRQGFKGNGVYLDKTNDNILIGNWDGIKCNACTYYRKDHYYIDKKVLAPIKEKCASFSEDYKFIEDEIDRLNKKWSMFSDNKPPQDKLEDSALQAIVDTLNATNQSNVGTSCEKDSAKTPEGNYVDILKIKFDLFDTIIDGRKLLVSGRNLSYLQSGYKWVDSEGVKALLNTFKNSIDILFPYKPNPDSVSIRINIIGTTDGIDFSSKAEVNNVFSLFNKYPIKKAKDSINVRTFINTNSSNYLDNSINIGRIITNNEQLAFIRTVGIRQYIEDEVEKLSLFTNNKKYNLKVNEDTSRIIEFQNKSKIFNHFIYNYSKKDTGAQYRIISLELIIENFTLPTKNPGEPQHNPNLKPQQYDIYSLINESTPLPLKDNRKALIINNNSYNDTIIQQYQNHIKYSDNNTSLIFSLLNKKLGFKKENIDTISNTDIDKLEGRVNRFIENSASETVNPVDLIIYYTGYACWKKEGLMLYPTNLRNLNNASLKSDLFPIIKKVCQTMNNFSDNINSITIIIDGAYKDAMFSNVIGPQDIMTYVNKINSQSNRIVVLTSGERSLIKDDEPYKQFTYYFTNYIINNIDTSLTQYMQINLKPDQDISKKMYFIHPDIDNNWFRFENIEK